VHSVQLLAMTERFYYQLLQIVSEVQTLPNDDQIVWAHNDFVSSYQVSLLQLDGLMNRDIFDHQYIMKTFL